MLWAGLIHMDIIIIIIKNGWILEVPSASIFVGKNCAICDRVIHGLLTEDGSITHSIYWCHHYCCHI